MSPMILGLDYMISPAFLIFNEAVSIRDYFGNEDHWRSPLPTLALQIVYPQKWTATWARTPVVWVGESKILGLGATANRGLNDPDMAPRIIVMLSSANGPPPLRSRGPSHFSV